MTTIPQPKTMGPLGNLPLMEKGSPVQSLIKIAGDYGPIFRLELPTGSRLFVWGHDLVADACDESRFDKEVSAALRKVRPFAGDGLFTAETKEPNWQKAHNILLPSFSQSAMRGYHNMMVDIAVQLVQKWERLNPDESVDVPEDMTRLTLDTIGLCGFNYRFNSFYKEEPHPFIVSMVRALDEAMNQLQRLGIQDKLMVGKKRQFKQDTETMFELVDHVIAERRAGGTEGQDDLLSLMLQGVDPATGESLDDENIRYQIITFLIAGHETTSGLLSFAVYYLLKHPEVLKKAQEEVDRVLKDPVPSYTQVRELKYVRMILNEALRLWPTAPAFALMAEEDTVLAERYPLQKGDTMTVLIPKLHRDPGAWGEDAEDFRPERFERPEKVPHHAYKPFGNGQRACIGQQFALHEATLVLGMILKRFEFIDHTDYELKVKETLTLKPDGFTMKVRSRGAAADLVYVPAGTGESASSSKPADKPVVAAHGTPLLVLYGSNMGTAEGIARDLAETGRLQGFASEVKPLDEAAGSLPGEGMVLIVSASYNGKPPSNARKFVQWLEQEPDADLSKVRYAVFGCGDRNWAGTYQDVPRWLDEQLAARGARRIVERGEADASGDFEQQIDGWDEQVWPELLDAAGVERDQAMRQEKPKLSLQFVSGSVGTPIADSYGAVMATVQENRELQTEDSERSTRHLEIALPEGVTYREGDHLGVLPENSPVVVERVLRRFGLSGGEHVVIQASGRSAAHLPMETPVSVRDLLTHTVELQEAATRAQLRELAAATVCPPHQVELERLLQEEVYPEEILQKRVTMLDLLEQYAACELSFDRFVELLPALKPRYYSISSSPSVQQDQASITVAVVRGPARSGKGEYRGVATGYLTERELGDSVMVFVSTPDSGFQLPEDPQTPLVMVGPGTGLAPFRGFLQARRQLQAEGVALGEAHLYFGCRNACDHIYREEMTSYEEDGIVSLHTAYSRMEGQTKTYVQHLMKDNAETIIRLLDVGGKLYICGDGSRMAPDVEAGLLAAYREIHGVSEAEADAWLERLDEEQRYAKDVWAGN